MHPWGPVHFRLLEPRSENQIEHDGREYDQPEIAVRPEALQAIVRIIDIERGHLPEEMGTRSRHAKKEHDLGPGQEPGYGDSKPSKRIEP